MEQITTQVPQQLEDKVDELVDQGRFESKSAFVRYALRQALAQEHRFDNESSR